MGQGQFASVEPDVVIGENIEVEGARRRFVRLADGTEVDDLILVRFFDAPRP